MKARHLIKDRNPPYHSVATHQSMAEAVELMMTHRISSLVVTRDGRPVSIVTERDVLRTVYQHGGDFSGIQVEQAMAPELVTCEAEDSLDDIMELLFHNKLGKRIRHLPVMDNGSLVGVISIRDIVSALLTETRFENQVLRSYIKNWPEPGD